MLGGIYGYFFKLFYVLMGFLEVLYIFEGDFIYYFGWCFLDF